MTPVTIVTGSLGAGKTTLVNHVLTSQLDRRIGVLVNDFGEIDIDRRLIAGVTGSTDVVALTNGCICCSMRNDVVSAVFRVLEHERPPEHLLVEASGVSNPGALAEIFLGLEKSRTLRLDGIAAVLDAERFPYASLKTEPLARDQFLASDLVLLNKVDLVDEPHLEAIERAIRGRVPEARIIRTTQARIPAAVLLGIGGANHATHATHADEAAHAHAPPQDPHAHGFETFAFASDQPLDFKRLADTIRSFPPAVVRVKGIISVRERPGDRLALNCVGKRVHVETIGSHPEARSEMVVIGTSGGFDASELKAALEQCRVTSDRG